MKSLLLFTFCLSLPSLFYAQIAMNMNLMGTLNPTTSGYNDIWGFAWGSKEYAILGGRNEIFFIDVTNPYAPSIVNEFSETTTPYLDLDYSLWRDFKTYQNYAYAVDDQGGSGLIIFDLSTLPGTVTLDTQITTDFTEAHNIYVEPNAGRLYVVGADTKLNGVIVYDLSNPGQPSLMASVSLLGYIHDVHVSGNTAYCSHAGLGIYSYDMTDPVNPGPPVFIADEGGYNHSSWLSPSGGFLIFAEETHGKPLYVANPTNGNIISTFKFPLEAPNHTNSIAHNPFILGDKAFISYYHDGVQVIDLSNPANPQLAGYYDTYPNNSNYSGFAGCWGVYPYLPSGNIIASDMSTGLYVLDFTGGPLPVELLDFSVQPDGQHALLQWRSAREENTMHFEIQHSRNGERFHPIGQIEAAGTSNSIREYEFNHFLPGAGDHYYRLKMVDQDGSFTFSTIDQVRFELEAVQVFPTLTTPGQPIQFRFPEPLPQEGLLQVHDATGRVVWKAFLPKGSTETQWPGAEQSGWYQLNWQLGNQEGFQSIVVH